MSSFSKNNQTKQAKLIYQQWKCNTHEEPKKKKKERQRYFSNIHSKLAIKPSKNKK